MKKNNQPLDNQITIYQSPDGGVNIEVLYAEENIWLSQKRMADFLRRQLKTSLSILKIFIKKESLMKTQLVRNTYKFKKKDCVI